MNNNLIPTPRTDKNGRTVIRHMKNNNTSAPALTLPAPTPSTSDNSADRLLSGLLETIKGMDLGGNTNVTAGGTEPPLFLKSALNSLRYGFAKGGMPERTANVCISGAEPNLRKFSNATLERIQNHPWNRSAASTVTFGAARKWTETTVNDYMAVARALKLTEGYAISIMQTDSWNLYPDLHAPNNDGEYPEERLSQLVALYRITQYMEDHEDDLDPYWYDERSREPVAAYLHMDDLREFVLHPEEPYKREDIVDTIIMNSVFDVDRIKAMLDSGSASLSSGVL